MKYIQLDNEICLLSMILSTSNAIHILLQKINSGQFLDILEVDCHIASYAGYWSKQLSGKLFECCELYKMEL
jgi:hypothetical protein